MDVAWPPASCLAVVLAVAHLVGCAVTPGGVDGFAPAPSDARPAAILVAHLGRDGADPAGFAAVRRAFRQRNEGFDVRHHPQARRVPPASTRRVVFVREPTAGRRRVPARVEGAPGAPASDVGGGDVVLLPPGGALVVEEPLDFLVFDTPVAFPEGLPAFIRPDWDERITDTPGGCATETGAYRRILLTWLPRNGPYVYHALNAHRVRITDSFSHYHPVSGGFDEFYLVEMVQPGGRIIVSRHTDLIERPGEVTAVQAADLLEAHALEVGDLVYIPRGIVHRGVGGVLAQVITVPGFRPGAEIGVDHHLRAINERLSLPPEAALPFHEAASREAVVR